MNPAFLLLAILALIALWFMASGLYKLIGMLLCKIGGDAIHELTQQKQEEKEQ